MAEHGMVNIHPDQGADEDETTYCAVHPDRETSLRCNRCERLMCAQCAVQTPIGYRCRECVREVESGFFTGTNLDYLTGFGVSAAGGGLGAVAVGFVPFWLLAIFLGIIAGGFIAQLVIRFTGRRRGRYTAQVTTGGTLIGVYVVSLLLYGALIPPFPLLIFGGLAAAAVWGRFNV